MNEHVQIENTDLVREMSSKAILPTNRSKLRQYKEQRNQKLQDKAHRNSLESRVGQLEARLESLEQAFKELCPSFNSP